MGEYLETLGGFALQWTGPPAARSFPPADSMLNYSRCRERCSALACVLAVILCTHFASDCTADGTQVASSAELLHTEDSLAARFRDEIVPLVASACSDCHSETDPEAKLDLARFSTAKAVAEEHSLWTIVRDRVAANEMPPEDATPMTDEQRRQLVTWIDDLRDFEAARNAGDPGIVLPRRLSNSEYNRTIRDLTGVDINPTATFPVDPANEAGFDNSGESLSMTPALLNKYLAAARQVAEHLVLQPNGFTFAPFPVVTDTDRDKYCVNRIVEFYGAQPTDLSEYFYAAWQYEHRGVIGNPETSLDEVATAQGLSAKYLQSIWTLLHHAIGQEGLEAPLVRVQTNWRKLPVPATSAQETKESREFDKSVHEQCDAIGVYVNRIRRALEPTPPNLEIKGSNLGSQPLVIWKNRQYQSFRRSYDPEKLVEQGSSQRVERFHPDLVVPSDPEKKQAYLDSLKTFCDIIPDRFYVSERGRDYTDTPREKQDKGRLLSAGFHSMMGYYRDDEPLYDLVLDASQQSKLDRLWQELNFVTSAPQRQYVGHLWFERTDSRFMRDEKFDFARPENKESLTEPFIRRLGDVYYQHAESRGASDVALEAVKHYYQQMNDQIRWVENTRLAAESSHLEALVTFAERAYRRPLASGEAESLQTFYRSLRDNDALTHEEAIQDSLVAILMSPHFCFRTDLASPQDAVTPLSDVELASRLSYFLWSTMPDDRLLRLAETNQLHEPKMLESEVERMLRDARADSLATEFLANWLDIRRFEEHNSVDRNRFPEFTDELRDAMFQEPIRFFVDMLHNDRSVMELLDASHTFVNPLLATHYQIPVFNKRSEVNRKSDLNEWRRVDDATPFHRGGLSTMAVFLTKNSPGLRTSPVKRGYWVVKRLLGESIPAPPPNVPELPADESQLGEKSLRQMLESHRAHKDCAACHDRFDSIGLAFEAYGPVGEWRELDLGGRPVDTKAEFPDHVERSGVDGLREYLLSTRQADFRENFCRKLLIYALGRSLLLSDEPLVEQMQQQLELNDHRISVAIKQIVISPQFLTKRGLTQ
jgi:hypothetical protein